MSAKKLSIVCIALIVALIVASLGLIGCKRVVVNSIDLNETYLEMNVGDTATLAATVDVDEYVAIAWSSSHTTVATVDNNGTVTAVGAGATSIKASVQGKAAVCTVVVLSQQPPKPTSIVLSQNELGLKPNEQAQLSAVLLPSDVSADYDVVWKSFDTNVATVEGGLVKAVNEGSTTVIAYAGDAFATCKVTVSNDPTTPIEDYELKFKTFTVDGNTAKGSVSSATKEFYFENEIVAGRDVSYVVCKDLECTDVIPSKVASLQTGDNIFYVLATRGNVSKFYKVTIRRLASYTVTFDSNGGEAVEPITADEGTTIVLPQCEKTGYEFDRWFIGNYGCTQYIVLSDVTLKANFIPKKYFASFDTNNADTPQSAAPVVVSYDATYKFFVPTREGYMFEGWFVGDEQYTDSNGASLAPWKFTSDKTFVAHWTDKYALTLRSQGCENATLGADKYRLAYGETANVSVSKVALGYHFVGWYNGDELLSSNDQYTVTMPNGDLTLTAKFEVNDDVANLVFTSTYETFEITDVKDASITEVTIPEYATKLSVNAFENCQDLQTVNWLAEYCRISKGESPFANCNIVNVNVGSKVKSFYYSLFYRCANIQKVDYDGDIISWCAIRCLNEYSNPLLYSKTFYLQGESAYNIDLPRDITINKFVFGRVEFGEVNYLGRLEDWLALANNFSSNTSPATYAESFYLNGEEIEHLVIPQTVTDIGKWAFSGIKTITRVTFHSNVKSVGDDAFWNCENLTRVDVPDVESWLNISFGLNYGSSNPLYYAKDLYVNGELVTEVVVPEGITEIKPHAFARSSITGIQLPASVTTIGKSAFEHSDLTTCDLSNVTYIGDWAFSSTPLTGELVIPNGVTYLGERAFDSCKGITSLTIGSGLKTIAKGAFCSTGIESLTIAEGFTEIGASAFYGCNKLTYVELPASVYYVASTAFDRCSNLTKIYYKGTQPQWEQIEVEDSNEPFENSTVYYYSESEPALNDEGTAYSGYYWHYVNEQIEEWQLNCRYLTQQTVVDGEVVETNVVVYDIGEQVTLTASCNLGYDFVGWYNGEELLTDELSYTFTMHDHDFTLTVKFKVRDEVANFKFTSTATTFEIFDVKDTSVTEITIPTYATKVRGLRYCENLQTVNYLAKNADCSGSGSISGNLENFYIGASVNVLSHNLFRNCVVNNVYYMGTVEDWCNIEFGIGGLIIPSRVEFNNVYFDGVKVVNLVTPATVETIPDYAFCYMSMIESVVISEGVKEIGGYAFRGCGLSGKVVIPNSVTKIAVLAFADCDNITEVVIGSGIETIQGGIFRDCTNLSKVCYYGTVEQWNNVAITPINNELKNDVIYFYSETEPALNDEGTAYVGNYWHYIDGEIVVWTCNRRALTAQTVVDGKVVNSGVTVYEIGEQVSVTASYNLGYDFVGWYNGEELLSEDVDYQLIMPESNLTLTAKYQIDSRVANLRFTSTETEFKIQGVKDLSVDIVIPEYTTEIASTAFGNELTKVTWLPSSVGSADNVFNGCNIGEFVIDQAVTELPADLFKTCKSIGSVIYNGSIESWVSIVFENVNSNPLRIATEFVVDGEPVTELVVPNTVTAISDYAFYGAGFLASVTFERAQQLSLDESSGLNSIGNYAFSSCKQLTECVLPQGLTSIGEYAFSYSALGGDLVIPDSVTEMGEHAFANTNIVSVTILEGLSVIPSKAFYGCSALVNATIRDGVTEIGKSAFEYCKNLETVLIPSSVENVCALAFFSCEKLTDLTISEGVQNILEQAFVNCKALESVVIPSTVKVIGQQAFRLCSNLTNVTISDGVREINNGAFLSTELTSVVLPSSIEKLNLHSLGNKLSELYYNGTAEQWEQIDASNFDVENVTVYFYSESEPALNDEVTAYNGNYWHYVDDVIVVWSKDDNE